MPNKSKLIIFLSWLAVFLWMIIIFNFSSQVGEQSDGLSRGLVNIVVAVIGKVAPGLDFDLNIFDFLIRKTAHFTVYLVLCVLTVNALLKSGLQRAVTPIAALGISILFAGSDEVHQLFIPGRSGQVRDIIIDGAGAAIGCGLYLALRRSRRKRSSSGR